MILSLFRKSTAAEPVYTAYAAIVAQSRQPRFYAEWGVPDTVTGRFDMISLHLALLLRRLRNEGAGAKEFSQALFDLFFKDMDRSLRQMGAGDLAVPKKIQKMADLFYGLLANLDTALATESAAEVEGVLARNVYGDVAGSGAALLAHYIIAESKRLADVPASEIMAGRLTMGHAA
ncbi:MAG TPA: ubiquinol-cytochrome C chaperone family protein [Devosiaceae bacterium]|jgi:cytochrome b pre-mRNA-processing protein 3|nr:ubiquinol-cytochrome C chaperone family protein [Devosiaceae bacterium]